MDIIIFRKVFNNYLLNKLIFKQVHHIFVDILNLKTTYKWNEVIESRYILAGNGYLNHLKEYYRINNNDDLNYNRSNSVIYNAFKSKSLDIIKYVIEELNYNHHSYGLLNQEQKLIYTRCDLLYIASKYGNIEIVQYIESLEKSYTQWNYIESFKISPLSNDFKVLQFLYNSLIDNHQPLDDLQWKSSILNSLSIGRIDFVEWLISLSRFSINLYDIDYLTEAVKSGKLNVLQFCLSERKPDNRKNHLISNAAIYGYLDIIEWLYENGISDIEDKSFENASSNGHWEVIKWLYHKTSNTFKNSKTLLNAAKDGQFDIYRQLSQENCFSKVKWKNITIDSIEIAAESGNFEMLIWLHQNLSVGCKTRAMDYAVENGHLEMIKWLHHNRTERCTTNAMDYAVYNGHLETIKWLHENRSEGCTTKAMDNAAWNGHFEIVKWLHENRTEGCTTQAMSYGASSGHFEIVKWLHHNRTEGCTNYAMTGAASHEHLEILKWLHENRTEGCTTDAMDFAAWNGHFEIVKWLHHNRTEGCTTNAMDFAAMYGHFEIIKWLHHNRTEGCTSKAMDYAAEKGHFEIIKWLHENRTESSIEQSKNQSRIYGHLDICEWFEIINGHNKNKNLFL